MVIFRKYLSPFMAPSLAVFLSLGFASVGCVPSESEVTREDFCGKWARAACTSEVVSVCQASNVDDCRATQQEACLDDLPQGFVDRGVDECIEAVKNAYKDADLTAKELDVVARYGGACSDIFIANDAGERCASDVDCESALRCVLKDEHRGSCQHPVVIEPGFSCSAPEETCEEGFYCDGSNCLAALEEGDDCNNDAQCGLDMFCDDTCTVKIEIGDDCKSDSQCRSGICYESSGNSTCLDRLRLSPAEPLCAALK